jgi:hypothetical protein
LATAGTAYVSIRGDFGPLNTGLRRSQGAFGNSLGKMETQAQRTFRRIGALAKVGTIAGIAGLGIAARKAFSEFEEAERATRQTEAVLKSTGGAAGVTAKHIEQLANKISLKSGKDDEAIQSAENLLLTFTSVRNEVGKGNDVFDQATTVVADMSAALGQDFKASTIQVGKALQDPIKGITALRRVGVNFNETQTETVKKMVESGNQLGAQKFILRELRTEFEGSAEAQATASDKMRVAINNLLESFGKAFGPALSDAFQGLANFITQMQTGVGVGGKFADVIRGIGTAIEDTFTGVGDVFGSLFGGDTSGLDNAESKVSGLKLALEDIGRVVGPVFAAMGKIGEGFSKAFEGVDQDLAAIGRGLLAISHAVAAVLGPITERILPGIVTAFKGFAQVLRGLIQVIAGILTLDFGRAWDGVENIFKGQLKVIGGLMRAQTAVFREAAVRLGRAISSAFSGLWDGIKSLFRTGLRATADVLKGYVTVYRTAAVALARAVLSAFNILRDLPGKVAEFVGRIPGAIRGVIGRAVNAGEAVGRAIIRGLTNALRGIGGLLGRAIKSGLGGLTLIPKIKIDPPGPGSFSFGPIKFPDFAKGGKAHGWAVVGEEGPELAHFSQPTDIVSHPLSKKMAKTMGVPGFAKGTRGSEELARDVTQIVRTPERKFVFIDKTGKAVKVEDSARTIPVEIKAPVVDLSAIESPKLKVEVEEAVKKRREPGGDAATGSRRIARTSQVPGVAVTPSEVSQITRRWSVNRAVASIGAAVEDKFPLMQIISGLRPGATTRGGSRSNHAIRAALDLGTGRNVSLNRRIGSWVRSNFPKSLRGVTEDVLDIDHDPNPPDHADHVHVAALGERAIAKVMQTGADGTGVGGQRRTRVPRRVSLGQLVTIAKQVGFPDPALAAAVAFAESRGDVGATGDGGDSHGLWQIHSPSHSRYDPKKLESDAFYNARAALQISGGGRNFNPWTQYRNAAYKQFLKGKAEPLPRGKSTSPTTGSRYTDYLEMRMVDAESSPGFRDDIRWVNRAMRYWRGVVKRNRRAGNFRRVVEGLNELKTLRERKKELKAPQEEALEEVFKLGGLSTVGTGPRKFNIAGMQGTLDKIDLEAAQASLTIPADGDDSFGALKASLQDDIAAAKRLVSIRESLNTLVSGFRLPGIPLDGPFKPNTAQRARLKKAKSNQERIDLLNGWIAEATQGPWIQGTGAQKTEAATDLATARSGLQSLMDEAGPGAERQAGLEAVNSALAAKQALAALTPDRADDIAAARESVALYQSRLDQAKAAGDNSGIAENATALKAAIDDLNSLLGANALDLNSFLSGLRNLIGERSNIKAFHEGGPIEGPKGQERIIRAESGEFVIEKEGKNLIVKIDPSKIHGEGQKIVNVDARHTFATVPKEPHLWSQQLNAEVEGALT